MASVYASPDRGLDFGRYTLALAKSEGSRPEAHELACAAWGPTSQPALALKAVAAGTTTDAAWAGPLTEFSSMVGEFIALVRARSIIGQAQLRGVPLNCRVFIEAEAAVTAYWVGQAAAKPITSGALDAIELPALKLASIAVLTQEVINLSVARPEAIVSNVLAAAVARTTDEAFIGTGAGTPGVEPAGILAGIVPIAATSDPIVDLSELIEAFEGDLSTAFFAMRPSTAVQLALRGARGNSSTFVDLGARGGSLFGVPAIVSKYVGAGSSPVSGDIVLIDGAQVLFGAGGVEVATARHTSLEMLNDPTNNSATGTATSMVSMYQTNSVALRVERFINWTVARPGAVAWIQGANYTSA